LAPIQQISLVDQQLFSSFNESRWWFQTYFFHPYLEKLIQFDEHIFQMGWFNHQPEILSFRFNLEVPEHFPGLFLGCSIVVHQGEFRKWF